MRSIGKRPLIAVIDDDIVHLDMLCTFLTDVGYEVITSLTGAETITLIRRSQPDLIILDIQLEHPEADLTVLELLRLVPATNALPVIVCSADTSFLWMNEPGLRKLQCEIVHKPFYLDELLEKTIALVGLPQLRVAKA